MAKTFRLRIQGIRIVSGGQTGADRAALDWAIAHCIPHGGWCPPGRKAEDGPIPAHYQLTEALSGDYLCPANHPAMPIDIGPEKRPYYVLRLVWDQAQPDSTDREIQADRSSTNGLPALRSPETSDEKNTK